MPDRSESSTCFSISSPILVRDDDPSWRYTYYIVSSEHTTVLNDWMESDFSVKNYIPFFFSLDLYVYSIMLYKWICRAIEVMERLYRNCVLLFRQKILALFRFLLPSSIINTFKVYHNY